MSLGVPRSGTILVFNVLREILTQQKIPFRAVNTNYPETEHFLRNYDFADNVLLHAHNVLPEVQKKLIREDVVAFFNHRDPRDIVVSMMRLHDYSFERCMELAEISFRHLQAARQFPRVVFIPYREVIDARGALVVRIARRIGVELAPRQVSSILEATSLEAHRKIMQDVAAETIDIQRRNNPRRTLKESKVHFINDRHIQSGRAGRWRDELSAEHQRAATERFARVLEDLGYSK